MCITCNKIYLVKNCDMKDEMRGNYEEDPLSQGN